MGQGCGFRVEGYMGCWIYRYISVSGLHTRYIPILFRMHFPVGGFPSTLFEALHSRAMIKWKLLFWA